MTRQLMEIRGNDQRLDGGSMFGNAPRSLWSRWIVPDADNRIGLATRALLVRDSGQNVLLEAGIGTFFPPKLRERYGVTPDSHRLIDNLAAAGLSDADIDVVVLSHLHFDHAGGLLATWEEGHAPQLLFPNATFVVGGEQLERASSPHLRDRASFIPELPLLLRESGRLEIVDGASSDVLGDGYRFHVCHGHTPGMLLTEVETGGAPVVFAADLVPGLAWTHVPLSMGFDCCPERTVDEKRKLLPELLARGAYIFYTHDPEVALAKLEQDERGRFSGRPAPVDEAGA